MTDLLTRPTSAGTDDDPGRRSVVSSAVGAAGWAAVLGITAVMVVVVLAWATSSSTVRAPAALRMAGALWLLAHHTGLRLDGSAFALVPLGLTTLVGGLLYRAGRSVARHLELSGLRDTWLAAGTMAASYAVICVVVAEAIRSPQVRAQPLQALAGGWLLTLLCAGGGIAHQSGLPGRLAGRLPARVRAALLGGLLAVAVVVAVAGLAVGGALLARHGRAAALAAALHADGGAGFGGLALLLLQLAFLPDVLGWAAAYLVGPGFSVGAGTAYSAFGYAGGPAPALPMLAALPGGPAPIWVRVVLVAVPLAAGAWAGRLVARRLPAAGPLWCAACGAGAGLASGAALAVLAALAAGSVGPGAMATVGASAWQVGLVAAAEIGAAAAAAAALPRLVATYRSGGR